MIALVIVLTILQIRMGDSDKTDSRAGKNNYIWDKDGGESSTKDAGFVIIYT